MITQHKKRPPAAKRCSLWCCLPLLLGLYSIGSWANDGIVIIDMPYDLLAALVEYEELQQREKQTQTSLDAYMVPVLQTILKEYQRQYQQLFNISKHFEDADPLHQRLKKMERFIREFQDELRYRQTLLEFQNVMKRQRELIDNK